VDAPLKKYEAILETLRAVLDSAGELRGSELQAQFATAKRGVEGLLDGIEEPTKGRLKQLLMPPVEGTARVGTSQGVHSASDDWKTTVWDALHTELIDHFPFNSGIHVREAANFDQFVSFFQPDGILWGFVHTRLADWIEPGAHGYVVKPGADALGGDLLTCLSVAQEITDAFFVPGEDRGMKLSVHADWSSPDVTEAKFWIGGKATPLPKGEWSPTLKWAGEDARLDWTQSGHVTQQIGRHAFSLFDLFQQLGGLKPGGSRGLYVVEFPPLTLKIRSDGREDALRADFFSRLHCPADIHMGAN
jgi:type VI protein secretion system component VasK